MPWGAEKLKLRMAIADRLCPTRDVPKFRYLSGSAVGRVQHAVAVHKHQDTPDLRRMIKVQ
jgi:hypothetical protein